MSTSMPMPVDMPMGWRCQPCGHIYSPQTSECWRCAPAEGAFGPFTPIPPAPVGAPPEAVFGRFRLPSPVRGFKPGDKVWPKAGSTMTLQLAPQTVIATWGDPAGGDWLWLDAGRGRLGSWTAVNWTTEEPDDSEKAARAERAERARVLAEENERVTWPPDICCTCGSPDVVYRNYKREPFCAPCANSQHPQRVDGVIYIPARDGLTPTQIRAAQGRLNDVADDLAIDKFIVLPPGSKVMPAGPKLADTPAPAGLYPLQLDVPVLELPAHMNRPGSTRRVRVQPVWEEAFPGLQVRGLAVGAGKGGGLAYDLEFRLTPEDSATSAAESEDRVTVSLPANMAEPGHRHVAKIGHEWDDIVEGQPLQGRLGSFGGLDEDAHATIDFRIAPRQGEA